MAWFRRGKKSDQDVSKGSESSIVEAGTAASATSSTDTVTAEDTPQAPVLGIERGPWDAGIVDGDEGYLKLGAIWVPAIEGLMLTFEMDQAQSEVTAVQVVRGDSTIQLQAFAAPRTAGLWDEIRAEIAEGIHAQGATAVEEEGEFGTELLVSINGGAMRFIGVDGPRWLLRGVITGRGAVDPAAAEPLRELLRHVVVDRGDGPMGPRELLSLELPTDGEADPEGAAADTDSVAGDDLDPFTRGPEITEIR